MSEPLKPPAIPSAVLNFFSGQPDFHAIAGDLAEEFQQRTQSAGAGAAKLWYWRESLRNAFALTARELYRTPVRTIFIAFAGLLGVSIISGLYIVVSLHLLSKGILLGGDWDPMHLALNRGQMEMFLLVQFIASFAMGRIGGTLLPAREWALALIFALISCVVLPGGWRLLMALTIVLPWTFWEFVIAVYAFRLSGFWLGTLWIRQSRNKRAVESHVS